VLHREADAGVGDRARRERPDPGTVIWPVVSTIVSWTPLARLPAASRTPFTSRTKAVFRLRRKRETGVFSTALSNVKVESCAGGKQVCGPGHVRKEGTR